MKRKLKPKVLISLYLFLIVGLVSSAFVLKNALNKKESKPKENLDYVSDTIIKEDVPVINEVTKMLKPFTKEGVSIKKNYYDYQAEASEQEKSIIYHDNTYIQNSGIDYVLEEIFDVVAVLDGTVTNVKEDDLLGKTIEIKHDNDYITEYQSLSEVTVKKGDTIKQGTVIGKSGTNKLDSSLGNHLHFELYISGKVVNPIDYIDKAINKDKKSEENKDTTKGNINTTEETKSDQSENNQ